MQDRDQLLDEISDIISKKETFGINYLLGTLLLMALVVMILFPKVYLQTQIYYKSRDIAILKSEHKLLKEENKIITRKVEEIRFKNQVLDSMY